MPVNRRSALLASLAACSLATAAEAAPLETWVSVNGNDGFTCGRVDPCLTLAGAVAKTAAGGIVTVLDAGSYGPATIDRAITIQAQGVRAGVVAPASNGIVVNAPSSAAVVIRGLDINGGGTGFNGIRIVSAKNVQVENTHIGGFTRSGITANANVPVDLYLDGVDIVASEIGVLVDADGRTNRAFVTGSHITENATAGVKADGTQSKAFIRGSTVAGSGTDLVTANGGTITSYGDNLIRSGTPSSKLPLK